jgi:hypothetical protein
MSWNQVRGRKFERAAKPRRSKVCNFAHQVFNFGTPGTCQIQNPDFKIALSPFSFDLVRHAVSSFGAGRFDLDTLKLMQQAFDTSAPNCKWARAIPAAHFGKRINPAGGRRDARAISGTGRGALAHAAPPPSKQAHGLFKRGNLGSKQAVSGPPVGTDRHSRNAC